MATQTFETNGVRVAVEGCGHGTLNAIYAAVTASCEARGWDGVDILIIGGDFQAARNAADLTVMSVPAKYRELGDFWEYYAGLRTAPYLTVFAAGNHEAAAHLWELYYGGWAATNIYYLGAANVLRLGPLRIAAMSGIWKGFDYRKPHHERLPMGPDEIKSFYHVREVDVRKLLLLREQVDVGVSHDWPRGIEKWGDQKSLWRMKPDFERESMDGTLGNVAAEYVCDRLRPPYWFSAHLHCKYAALKIYKDDEDAGKKEESVPASGVAAAPAPAPVAAAPEGNPDEIDLDGDEEITDAPPAAVQANPNEIDLDDDDDEPVAAAAAPANAAALATAGKEEPASKSAVPEELRAQLPASFARPQQRQQQQQPKRTPGQPVPPTITNKQVNFLALDKCLPRRNFLQLLEARPHNLLPADQPTPTRPFRLQYDPEWLAITRVFHSSLKIGDPSAQTPPDLGEAHYTPLIDAERQWVEDNVVSKGRLDVPLNFEITAPPHTEGEPESVPHQPFEYTSPQTAAFCELLELTNMWDASEEERLERKARGPPAGEFRGHRGGGGGGRGFGRGGGGRGGRGGRGRGRGRGRGWH